MQCSQEGTVGISVLFGTPKFLRFQEDIICMLKKVNYSGWMVFEIRKAKTEPNVWYSFTCRLFQPLIL